MEIDRIVVRAVFTFVGLLVLLRVSGKRAIAQGSTLDFVVALIIGDLVDDAVYGQSPMSHFVVGTSAIILAHMITGWAATLSPRFHDWTEGKPSFLLLNGRPNTVALRAERTSGDGLAEQLRHYGLMRQQWRTIRRAILEINGRLSVIFREHDKPVQKCDRARLKEIRR